MLVRTAIGDEQAKGAETVVGDILEPTTLGPVMEGVDTVIHLVAIIEESKGLTFDRVIRQGTENVVAAARAAGVGRFVHMSAMGAQSNPAFPYLNAKWQAEEAVRGSGMEWTIFRPSVIFGKHDGFINVLADLVRKAPILPVVGSGQSKFHPVAVGDVADSFKRAVDDPATAGQVYELGGGEIYTYEGMLDVIAAELGKKKSKVHVPAGLMKLVVTMSSPLPKALRPPVTSEQLKMLALDNCTDHSATAELIGRAPIALRDGIGYVRSCRN
jgi:NADH dehydrogenase